MSQQELAKIVLPFVEQVRVPDENSKVYKDECCFSFETPECEGGLFVDLNSFMGFSRKYVSVNFKKTQHRLYLKIRRIKTEKIKDEKEPPKKKPTVVGIGVSGGFDVDEESNYNVQEFLSLVVVPDFVEFQLEDPNIPEKIQISIAGIMAANSASKKDEVNEWVAQRAESKYARDLKQLDNGVKVPPSGHKCSKCDLRENLWMNLTDGTILCGRKHWDGSGGNGHALEHFQNTGYPLCVKLGTITSNGEADVFSYAEDEMVEDPLISEHLAHFGIKLNEMKKTEKTMAELEIDQNTKFDWARIQEEDKILKPKYGPGYTGIQNLGNSCYMNSVLQTVFSLEEFQNRYHDSTDKFADDAPMNPTEDFYTQFVKVANGLLSGEHSKEPEKGKDSINGIVPRMFKTVIGKGHPEFSTMRQQDALEFFQYLLTIIERDEHKKNQLDVSSIFKFEIEEKIKCTTSGKVRYTKRVENVLSLPIPLEKSMNSEEVKSYEERQKNAPTDSKKENPVRPRIPLSACVDTFMAPEEVPDFYSSAIKSKTLGIRESKFASFPDYLMLHMRKFTISEDWTPKKLDVFLDVPDELNLEAFRSLGKQDNEEDLPEEGTTDGPSADEGIIQQLVEMGFPRERSLKAAIKTNNSGPEEAMNWLFEHMDDPDIDSPLDAGKSKNAMEVNEEGVMMLESMGFSREQAIRALEATENNVERATEWIFSHPGDSLEAEKTENIAKLQVKDGQGKYRLKAFVSHIGGSVHSGHYVCHILKEGEWILFNDKKVAISENPPKDMGYLYLYERI